MSERLGQGVLIGGVAGHRPSGSIILILPVLDISANAEISYFYQNSFDNFTTHW